MKNMITIIIMLFLITSCGKPKSEPLHEECGPNSLRLGASEECHTTPIEEYTMTQVASISPSCILFRFYDPEHNAHYICKDIKDIAPDPIVIRYQRYLSKKEEKCA